MSEPLPDSVESGGYSLVVTTAHTEEPETRWHGDIILVGELFAPPTECFAYLPVVRRQSP